MNENNNDKRLVLLVEDDGRLSELIDDRLRIYCDSVDITLFSNSGEVISYLDDHQGKKYPQAMILDLMMPYGENRTLLDPDEQDLDENSTGLNLLSYIRMKEKENNLDPMWVFIITARSPLAVKTKATELINGKGEIFFKPLDTNALEHRLMTAINVESKVPESLLIDDVNDSGAEREDG